MPIRTFESGDAPTLYLENIGGDLEIRGSQYTEIVCECDGAPFDVHTEGSASHIQSLSGCASLRVPEKTSIKIDTIGGSLKAKGLQGSLEITHLGGDCVIRRTQSVNITTIGGDADIQRVGETLLLGEVGGDFYARNITATMQVRRVGGDALLRSVPAGVTLEQVGGDLSMNSSLQPETIYHFNVGGDTAINVPPETSARFIFPQSAEAWVGDGFEVLAEGDQQIAVLGDGSATISIEATGDIRLRHDHQAITEDDFGIDTGETLPERMEDVSERLDAHLKKLEFKLGKLPDQIRSKVEHRLSLARRHVEAAERGAREAVAHMDMPETSVGIPVTQQERMMVLKMLEERKISVDEAQKLLESLE
jgi:hypothetical protein